MVRAAIDESNSYCSSFEHMTVMDGESPSPSLIPEMNEPSPQFLSESVTLHPSLSVHDLRDSPLAPLLDDELECT
jgi:hypothetical protein